MTQVETFFAILEERQTRRTVSRANAGVQHYYPPSVSAGAASDGMSGALQQMYRRLAADGMSADVEDRLMLMKDNLLKTARNRQTYKREAESMECVDLGVEHGVQFRPLLGDLNGHAGSATSSMAAQAQLIQEHQGSTTAPSSAGQPQQHQQQGGVTGASEEWNLMFGGPGDHEVRSVIRQRHTILTYFDLERN